MDGDATGSTDVDVPSGWELVDGALHREFTFADFVEAFGFMTSVALVAQRMDHHPDWSNSWNRVVVDLSSHDAGRVTERDVELARRMDQLAGGRGDR
jgi:4a-hydroxytetrahydrobiopterin dehydratase